MLRIPFLFLLVCSLGPSFLFAQAADSTPPTATEILVGEARELLHTLPLAVETGRATYYADYFHRRQTASGVLYDRNALVAAHRRYPFGTILLVTNLNNSRSVRVRVVDRGPFGRPIKGLPRVLDLSRRAAETLGYVRAGSAPVRIEVLEWGKRAKR